MSHIQFNRDSRLELAILLKTGKTQKECAEILGMHRTNVCLEIIRNKNPDGTYSGGLAHRRYLNRRKNMKGLTRKIENDKKLRRHIISKLKKFWSPEQIAGRLNEKEKRTIICHETIYTFMYQKRPDLIKYLRHQKSKYRKRRGSNIRIKLARAMKIRSIDERPAIVNERKRTGDWEGDTIIGKERKQRILTHVERKSGYGLADKIDTVTAEIVKEKTAIRFKRLPKRKRQTLTRDNGSEFGDLDKTLEQETNMEVYRATPYHSWERGSNENWNGLLRQFFPKGSYFANINQYQVEQAVRLLNDRPRKRLGYKTPREVFNECSDSD